MPPKLFFEANSVTTPVPSDSPYRIIFLLLRPCALSQTIACSAS